MSAHLAADARQAFVHRPTGTLVLNRPRLRALIDAEGLVLLPQGSAVEQAAALLTSGPGWGLRLRPTTIEGTRGRLALPPGRILAEGQRVRIEHRGVLIHELDNRPEALEQSFLVLAEAGADFSLRLRAEGSLTLAIRDGVLEARRAGRAVLAASAPRAYDADGRKLPAAWQLDAEGIAIGVRSAGRYPVWIDPAWEAAGEDQAGCWFGWSVAAAGDVNGDGFDDVVIGAPFFHTGNPSAGKVYLYYGSADGLADTPGWTSSGANANRALFGWALAAGDVDGDGYSDLIVGAPSRTGPGQAFLFAGSFNGPLPASWTSAGDDQPGAFFGTSLAAAGDVNGDGFGDVIVGAPAESSFDGPSTAPGKAFVFFGSAAGLAPSAAWTASGDAQPGAGFGWSVAGAGDVDGDGFDDVLVGANLYDQDYADSGRAYLYLGSAAGPAAQPAWAESGDAQAGAQFGAAVARAGDLDADGYGEAIVGAPGYDTATSGAGRAYVYRGGAAGSGLQSSYWWVDSGSDRLQAQFGFAVAGAGDVDGDGFGDLLVGAPGDPTEATGAGRFFLFSGSPAGPLKPAAFADSGDGQAGAGFGGAVAAAGDINQDGAGDLLVGAYAADGASADSGKAFVYLGSAGPGPGVCEPPGAPCDDGQDCTHTDTCAPDGVCRGVPFDCDDQNPCTDDLCRPDGSCGHLHNQAPCNDLDPCTTDDTCSGAVCRGAPRDCSFIDDDCLQGTCDPATGQCLPLSVPDGTPCADSDPCTGGETCQGGVCLPQTDTCQSGGCGCAARGPAAGGPPGLLSILALLAAAWRLRAARSRSRASRPGRPG